MSNKRSREASFSPSADSPSIDDDSDNADDRGGKISAVMETKHSSATTKSAMQCSLPPHAQALYFDSIAAFEIHYQKDHTNRCSSCSKNFPTAHFLTLHIDEVHNPLRAELASKGEKTYACFVEDCEKICATPQKRKLHLVDKHVFPKSYNFRVVEFGIDRRTSMLNEGPHRRRVSTSSAPADAGTRQRRLSSQQGVSGSADHITRTADDDNTARAVSNQSTKSAPSSKTKEATIDELTDSLSALQFVPPSVRRQQSRKPIP